MELTATNAHTHTHTHMHTRYFDDASWAYKMVNSDMVSSIVIPDNEKRSPELYKLILFPVVVAVKNGFYVFKECLL